MNLTEERKRLDQKRRQQNGDLSEKMVELALSRRGFLLVEKVEVPFRIDRRTGQQFAKRKVSGDFRGVQPGSGRSLLVEAKHHDERLSWSAFRPHQITALDVHMAAGGITEVAWIDRGSLRFIPWSRFRDIGFDDHKSVVWTGTNIEIHQSTRGKREATTTKAATA